MSVETLLLPITSLPDALALPAPPAQPFQVAVCPPGSKSLTNRALLLAAVARGTSVLRRPLLEADDARQMRAALGTLGATIIEDGGNARVSGVGGCWKTPDAGVTLNLNNAGTAARFLAGAALLSPHPITIDGNSRMRERPIGELGDLLTQLGCRIEFSGTPGCPPMCIRPPETPLCGRAVDVHTTQSSQFVSALLLVSPWITGGLTIHLRGEITSSSYIAMTLGLLSKLGANVQTSDGLRTIRITAEDADGTAGLPPFEYAVEPDASGATYFWAAGAMVAGSRVRVVELDGRSLQGDAHFPDLLGRMGAGVLENREPQPWIEVEGRAVLSPVMADLSDMPDAAMTLAAASCFADGTSVLRGLATLRVKECDRIEAMRAELGKIGVQIESPVGGDGGTLTLMPPEGGIDCSPSAPAVSFETYDDHRIAMSLALIGLRRPNVTILNPACVAKTYPTFWREFAGLWKASSPPVEGRPNVESA